MLALRLLGPLVLSVDHDELDLGGTRQRVVLTALALSANRVVPVEQLIDAVWDSAPPNTARAQIQICVSGLRRVLAKAGDEAQIRTRPPGYLLEIPEDNLDIARFTSLVAAARTHIEANRVSEAVAALRSALSLWRGPALAGMYSEPLRRHAAQLEDARVTAIMERIRLDLALGRHEEIVGELFALVKEYPLRERLYENLMLALYRSGRQAEALEVCRQARATLMEELGIELGDSARRLETAILKRDPGLDVAKGGGAGPQVRPATAAQEPQTVVPRRLPATIADFTGRQAQLAEIKHALGSDEQRGNTENYGMRIVSISGKGGVGKSTLALRAAHELRDSYPDGHLYGDLESSGGDDRVRGVLARFLRALGVDGNAMPDDDEERGDLYRSRLANRRVLVVLDGATDEAQVMSLLPAGAGCAVVVTSRPRLSGLPGAHQIAIDVFDVDRSLELLATIVGEDRLVAEQAAARELVELCGGLPLAIRIAGARLASRAHWRIDLLVARLRNSVRRLDELSFRGLVLRSNIDQSYQVLSAVGQRLFRRFALVTTPDFPGWIAAALVDADPYDALEVVETLVDAQLLDTVQYPGERLRYRFHDLIRVYATELLNTVESEAERTETVERLLGAWLARAEHAHRKEHGGNYTILHGTAPRWARAAELEDIDEMGNQIEWLDGERRSLVSAVRLAADYELAEASWDLALTSVSLFEVKGYFDDWRETGERALAAAEAAGNQRGRAAMLYSLGGMHSQQTRWAEAERCYTAALEIFERLGDDHGYALALRNIATLDRLRDGDEKVMAKYEVALEKMRAVGDRVGEAYIMRNMAKVCIDGGDTDRAQALLEAALEHCRGVRYLRGEAQVLIRFAELHQFVNNFEQAHQSLNRVLLIVRDLGDRIGEAYALYRLGVVRQRSGRLDNAETTLQHALSLAEQVGERMVAGWAHYALGEIALTRGQETAGATHVEAALALFIELGATMWRAKALVLRADVHQGRGEDEPAACDLGQAIELLATVESPEAVRLRKELERNRGGAVFH
ncbi:MAG: BTAD domain-containing putative transcriptional regulator [Actinophytocola sp.]|uniref:AfsR/SARP family transcriptional regulator n=1 Tax=Actinophytocola sp. TaxID=1872138 RepID=UPI003C756613